MEKKNIIEELYNIVGERKDNPVDRSYTSYLFEQGLDKILKKVGEESSEVIIAAKNKDKDELVNEMSDLIYHLIVLMVNEKVDIKDIEKELKNRRQKICNKKPDKNLVESIH